jgi:DNA-binding transcriptional LysR family regulator
MTLVQLKHLIELAASGSFSQAALKLHLTQPALSRSIKALEEELGQPLFDRLGRKSDLTLFGTHIVQRARVLLDDANDLRQSQQSFKKGQIGTLRIGMGSGPGALLTTPLLMHMAQQYPQARVEVSRGSTTLLVQTLRERKLDALVLDIRSLPPSTDLKVQAIHEMKGAFMCRPGHPLAHQAQVPFSRLLAFPIASTPLSDEVARTLVEHYGPQAHPQQMVNLRSEEISGLLEAARNSDAIVLAIRASAPDLVEVALSPPLRATARFGLVTMASRTEAPLLPDVLSLMGAILLDSVDPFRADA